jgi:hypothetical protein
VANNLYSDRRFILRRLGVVVAVFLLLFFRQRGNF